MHSEQNHYKLRNVIHQYVSERIPFWDMSGRTLFESSEEAPE
jgi:hypothetical protein